MNLNSYNIQQGIFLNWLYLFRNSRLLTIEEKITKIIMMNIYADNYSMEKEILMNKESVENIAGSLDLSTTYIYNGISRGKRKLKNLNMII